ncbi:unnamed protein product [Larinioides sclopetarius]|uniref:Uncharacterized protein n=1 Tax=Larinioides sclopetarius TaxID=280406 RepID=A0AAV2A435_9ARAC
MDKKLIKWMQNSTGSFRGSLMVYSYFTMHVQCRGSSFSPDQHRRGSAWVPRRCRPSLCAFEDPFLTTPSPSGTEKEFLVFHRQQTRFFCLGSKIGLSCISPSVIGKELYKNKETLDVSVQLFQDLTFDSGNLTFVVTG